MSQLEKEVEVFGVNYERYSLGLEIQRLVKRCDIKTVLELPAHGAKACPSLYSLDFARAGCQITLVNGDRKSLRFYKELGLEKQVTFVDVKNLQKTGLKSNSYDLVWNFAFIPTHKDKKSLISEMRRLSKGYVSIFSVNGLNVGFPMHLFAHWKNKIEWSHGDKRFNMPFYLRKLFEKEGFQNVKIGVVDCPVWPDSVGFRDIRLHKSGKSFDNLDWGVPYVDYLKTGEFPWWFKWVYFVERLPVPRMFKYPYAHIFYVIGEK